jgi:hypothetical protein
MLAVGVSARVADADVNLRANPESALFRPRFCADYSRTGSALNQIHEARAFRQKYVTILLSVDNHRNF